MRRFTYATVVLAALVGWIPAATAAPAVQLVAHAQVKGSHVPREVLASIFLKQARQWGDGSPVLPVDQSVQSEVRSIFSSRVLKRPLFDVQAYWRRAITSGITPPPVKGSDQEVLAYVASTPGAIGYVAAGTPIPYGVKTLEVAN